MSSLKTLCNEVDEGIFAYFDTLDDVFRKQNEMNQLLKDGFLLMAKARYSMGMKWVSSTQYNLDDMTASVKVDEDFDNDENPVLTVSTGEEEKVESANINSDGLRRRTTDDEKPDDGTEKGVEEVPEVKKSPKKDPIRWFGVLVPQALRESQSKFRRAAELSCELAMLKVRCDSQRKDFRAKLENKESIIKGFANMSFSG